MTRGDIALVGDVQTAIVERSDRDIGELGAQVLASLLDSGASRSRQSTVRWATPR